MLTSDCRIEDATSSEAMTFSAFCGAIAGLQRGACCGHGGVLAAVVSPPDRHDGAFKRLGFDAWRDRVRSREPRVPTVDGTYPLPDVTVLPRYDAARPHVDVEVRDGRIGRIQPTGTMSDPPRRVLTAHRGAWVSAALADLHVHFPPDNVLRLTDLFLLQTLRHGVAMVRDAGDTDGTATPAVLTRLLSGELPGPEVQYAYGFVNAPPARWHNAFDYRHPSQAAAIVARLRFLGASWVKSYENLDRPRIAALESAAAAAGLGVLGHVPYGLGHEDALLADSQHLIGIVDPRRLERDHILDRLTDWRSVDQARLDVVRRASVQHRLALTPTLSATAALLELERYEAACEERTAAALPQFYSRIVWHPKHGIPAYRGMTTETFDRIRSAMEWKQRLIHQLHDDGVELRLGTDTQQPFVAPGVSLHHEIAAFVEAGLPRRVVLDIASRRAAGVLSVTDGGEVREGWRADLLVSSQDPGSADWTPERHLDAVVTRGRLVTTADLDAAIARELGRFEGAVMSHATRWVARFTMHRLARAFVG